MPDKRSQVSRAASGNFAWKFRGNCFVATPRESYSPPHCERCVDWVNGYSPASSVVSYLDLASRMLRDLDIPEIYDPFCVGALISAAKESRARFATATMANAKMIHAELGRG